MNPTSPIKFTAPVTMALSLLIFAVPGHATPVAGQYVDDSRCDVISDQLLSREIGDASTFPAIDAISYHDHRANGPVGVPDDGINNDWTVHMTNISGTAWRDLFFVADLGATIGNADGMVQDLSGAPGVFTDAFHIDAAGANANLLFESMTPDGIFEPGEQWEFAVTNFGTGSNSLPPEIFTPGVFSGSSSMVGLGGTNASILASPVPEPATLGAVTIVAASLLLRRRSRHSDGVTLRQPSGTRKIRGATLRYEANAT